MRVEEAIFSRLDGLSSELEQVLRKLDVQVTVSVTICGEVI
jgi:hypothetical protein